MKTIAFYIEVIGLLRNYFSTIHVIAGKAKVCIYINNGCIAFRHTRLKSLVLCMLTYSSN